MAAEAGLPPGVLNVVTGDGATGALLVEHPGVDKIAFTGSTEVGPADPRATAGTGKSLTLELGGKSPFIVFDDADLDGAVEGVVDAIWFNQGQVCCAGSRLLLQEGIARNLSQASDAPHGNAARRPAARQGHRHGRDRCAGAARADQGAGRQPGWRRGPRNTRRPTRYRRTAASIRRPCSRNVHPSSTVAIEEIFGPVVVAMTFRTPDEAVMLANNTRYGLAASVWSETIGLALDIAPKLLAGVVWVNATNLFDASVGFGGYRESGFGREGGREGMYEYLKPKAWSGRKARAKASQPPAPAVRQRRIWCTAD